MHRLITAALVVLLGCTAAQAEGDGYFRKNPFDAQFCAGLTTTFRSENAARLNCTNATTAIVVEYADYWPEAIGQSLALAMQTGLQPGIVLVCRNDRQHCDAALAAVESAFSRLKAPFSLWDCRMADASLEACKERE